MATPDVVSYYRASHLVVVNEWWHDNSHDPAFALEKWCMGSRTLSSLLYERINEAGLPPATRVVLKTWKTTLAHMGWKDKPTELTPL